MKKLNVFALIGMVFFNLIITLSVAITVYALLASAWIALVSFILSPILVLGAHVSSLQAFTFGRMLLACLLCGGSVLAVPFLARVTGMIGQLSKQYLAFNKDLIYR